MSSNNGVLFNVFIYGDFILANFRIHPSGMNTFADEIVKCPANISNPLAVKANKKSATPEVYFNL